MFVVTTDKVRLQTAKDGSASSMLDRYVLAQSRHEVLFSEWTLHTLENSPTAEGVDLIEKVDSALPRGWNEINIGGRLKV
jgi:hypothetical protein